MKMIIVMLSTLSTCVMAQTTIYNNSLGLPLGTSTQIGNTTLFNDSLGLPLGSATTIGNTTIYTNSLGLPLGSSPTFAPIDKFNNSSSFNAPTYSAPSPQYFFSNPRISQ